MLKIPVNSRPVSADLASGSKVNLINSDRGSRYVSRVGLEDDGDPAQAQDDKCQVLTDLLILNPVREAITHACRS